MSGEGGVNNFLLLITYVKKKDPQCLVVSIIIPIFVWTVERSESGGMSFAEGRPPPAYMFIFLLGVRQVGVHLLLIFQSSRPLLKTMNPIGSRLRYNPQR
jgi:hypothetical protein